MSVPETRRASPTQYYTYIYLREDGTPRYVGKGSDGRVYANHKGHRPPKNLELIITQDFESEEDAFFAEKFLISYYGRIDLGTGCLRNLTDGGEGASGAVHTIEAKEKIREAGRRPCKSSTKEKIGNAHRGRKFSEQRRESMRGWTQRLSPVSKQELLEHMSVAAKARPIPKALQDSWNPKTHCKRGHEFIPKSTYIDPKGRRACRVCLRNRVRVVKLAQNPIKTYCTRGHLRSPENLYLNGSCKMCALITCQNRRASLKKERRLNDQTNL